MQGFVLAPSTHLNMHLHFHIRRDILGQAQIFINSSESPELKLYPIYAYKILIQGLVNQSDEQTLC